VCGRIRGGRQRPGVACGAGAERLHRRCARPQPCLCQRTRSSNPSSSSGESSKLRRRASRDGYPQIGRGISTVEILGGRSRCCSSGSRLPSSVSTAVVNLGDDAAGFVFARFFGCTRSHASPNFGIALIARLGPPPVFAVDLVKLPRRRTSHTHCPRPSRNPRRRCGRFIPG